MTMFGRVYHNNLMSLLPCFDNTTAATKQTTTSAKQNNQTPKQNQMTMFGRVYYNNLLSLLPCFLAVELSGESSLMAAAFEVTYKKIS